MKQLHNLLPAYAAESGLSAFDIRPLKNVNENGLLQRSDHFMIVWLTKGQGTYSIGQQKGLIAHNQLLFIKPGQLNGLHFSDEIDGCAISFNSSFLDVADSDETATYGNFYQIFARTQIIPAGTELEDMQNISEMMMKEYTRNHLFRSEILKRYLKIFLIYLSGQFDQPAQLPRQTRNEVILDNFMALLEKQYRSQKMVAWYAESLSVTANYLNEVIKKTTGFSAGHHIRQRVALEAKRQAVSANSCMKSIAYDLGFCDMAHFSKFFKNTTGMNFSDFKNKDRVLHPVS
jgi:AraC family transcriptional activator of pobA